MCKRSMSKTAEAYYYGTCRDPRTGAVVPSLDWEELSQAEREYWIKYAEWKAQEPQCP